MHGYPEWFGWLLVGMAYAPYIAGGLVVAGVIYVVRKKK